MILYTHAFTHLLSMLHILTNEIPTNWNLINETWTNKFLTIWSPISLTPLGHFPTGHISMIHIPCIHTLTGHSLTRHTLNKCSPKPSYPNNSYPNCSNRNQFHPDYPCPICSNTNHIQFIHVMTTHTLTCHAPIAELNYPFLWSHQSLSPIIIMVCNNESTWSKRCVDAMIYNEK